MKLLFDFLEKEITTPTNYGWFHILFMALIITATVLLTVFFKDCNDKTFRLIALISWIVMLTLEIYKQFIYTFSYTDFGVVGKYQWYAFPYQLCSTPLYILPMVAFMKEGKARDFFTAYLSTFSFFGGVVVFFYPNDVFCSLLGINVQTMVHHGLQVVIGIFMIVHEKKKINLLYFLKGVAVFAGLAAIAIALNEIVYAVFASKGIDQTFNMFYISRHFPVHLPILSTVYETVPYIVYLAAYLVVFSIAALLVLYLVVGIIKLTNLFKIKKNHSYD